MKNYSTEQRQQLLAFLKKHRDRQFSVDEISEELNACSDISISSVYRNINKMVENGDIVRRAVDGSRKFTYQYVGDSCCQSHIHMKCEACGKLVHVDSELSEYISKMAACNNDFNINKKKTILYGSCVDCKK